MREGWERTHAPLTPRRSTLETLAAEIFPGAKLLGVEAVKSGLVNDNFRLTFDGRPQAALLRYWRRGLDEASKEVALLRRLAPRALAPQVLFAGPADPDFGLPFGLLQWIGGERLNEAARRDPEEAPALGRCVGGTLAAIHAARFERQGFFGADLAVVGAYDATTQGQLAWLGAVLETPAARRRLGVDLSRRLTDFVASHGEALAGEWARKPTLTHGDFDATNILVARGEDGAPSVAAVLDWEFAFAGGPAFDFGHVLRPPLGDAPGFIEALCAGYRAAGQALPADWRVAARLADLLSWTDFIAQPFCGEAAARSARAMIGRLIAQ